MDGLLKRFPSHKYDNGCFRLKTHKLKKLFLYFRFIGEEETSDGKKAELTNDPTWIIDPVDGTMNFVHSFPHSAISIALLVDKVSIVVVFGIIYAITAIFNLQ